ncbi:hypothetical protein D3C75_1322680 [compost metagenome]
MHGLLRVTAGRVINGHVETEVMTVDTQLCQFVGADQQVQGQLLVSEVITEYLREKIIGVKAQRQLQRTL